MFLIFVVTLMLVLISSKEMCLYRFSTYHLKAHRISNNMVLKLPAQRYKKKEYMVIRNVIQFFSGQFVILTYNLSLINDQVIPDRRQLHANMKEKSKDEHEL